MQEVASLPLELVWGLHSLHLLPLHELLSSVEAVVTGYLVPALVATSAACQGEIECRARAMLQGVSAFLLGEAVCEERDSGTVVAQKILYAVMEGKPHLITKLSSSASSGVGLPCTATFPPSSSSFPPYTICEAMAECSMVERGQVTQFLSSYLSFLFLSHPSSSCETHSLLKSVHIYFNFTSTVNYHKFLSHVVNDVFCYTILKMCLNELALACPACFTEPLSFPPVVSVLAQQHQWKAASLPPHSTALYTKVSCTLPQELNNPTVSSFFPGCRVSSTWQGRGSSARGPAT